MTRKGSPRSDVRAEPTATKRLPGGRRSLLREGEDVRFTGMAATPAGIAWVGGIPGAKSVMRKVDQYAKDRKIGNGMSDKRNEESSRLCP